MILEQILEYTMETIKKSPTFTGKKKVKKKTFWSWFSWRNYTFYGIKVDRKWKNFKKLEKKPTINSHYISNTESLESALIISYSQSFSPLLEDANVKRLQYEELKTLSFKA